MTSDDKSTKWSDRVTTLMAWVLGIVSVVGVSTFVGAVLKFWLPSMGQWSQDVDTPPALNLVGDALGPFASVFSALALVAAFLTLHMQRQELREQREEVRATRREMAEQTKLLKLQGVAAEEQAKAARSQALRAEADPLQRYLSTCENTLHQVLDFSDIGDLCLFVRDLPVETPPLCENQPLYTALRDFRMRLHTSLARVEMGDSVPEIHERLDNVLNHLTDLRVKVLLWYSEKVAGRDVTSEQLQRVAPQSVE